MAFNRAAYMDELVAAQAAVEELDRLFASADAHDEIIRTGWIEQRNARLIKKYGSLEDARDVYARDDYEFDSELDKDDE